MSTLKRFYYIGTDDEFYNNLEAFLNKNLVGSFELVREIYHKGKILELISKKKPNIVFVDFTSLEEKNIIHEEIIFLKKINKFKSILFAALLSDSSEQREQMHLYSSGFQIGHVKGEEFEDFISNCLFISLDQRVSSPVYAKAQNINKDLEIGMCSTLCSISIDDFTIETDLELVGENLHLKLHIFKDLNLESFKIKDHKDQSLIYPMTDNYKLSFPFAGPWEDITTETIQKETVETWIDTNNEELKTTRCFLRIISDNNDIYRELYNIKETFPLFIDISDNLDIGTIKQDVSQKKPPLIFMDLNEDGPVNIESAVELINNLKKEDDYKPIIVILNNPSRADALKKVYGYQNIVCVPTPLSIELFTLFINRFLEKNKATPLLDNYFFKESDSNRVINVLHTICVTSLSENEITFSSPIKLPMFSVMHLELPIPCFVTLVPSVGESNNESNSHHYVGLIHGISESQKQLLRKFVNQIMFKPLSEFSASTVESILAQKGKVDRPLVTDEVEPKEKKELTFERTKILGKSKL